MLSRVIRVVLCLGWLAIASCSRSASQADRRYHFGLPGQPPAGDVDGNERPPQLAGSQPMDLQPGE